MARAGDVDHVQVRALDHAIQVHVDEVQARRRAPVPEQARLDVLERERLLQQRIVVEVDLSDRQVVGGAPVRVDLAKFGACQGVSIAQSWLTIPSMLSRSSSPEHRAGDHQFFVGADDPHGDPAGIRRDDVRVRPRCATDRARGRGSAGHRRYARESAHCALRSRLRKRACPARRARRQTRRSISWPGSSTGPRRQRLWHLQPDGQGGPACRSWSRTRPAVLIRG